MARGFLFSVLLLHVLTGVEIRTWEEVEKDISIHAISLGARHGSLHDGKVKTRAFFFLCLASFCYTLRGASHNRHSLKNKYDLRRNI